LVVVVVEENPPTLAVRVVAVQAQWCCIRIFQFLERSVWLLV
jgi:hypothetical protein